MEESETAFEGYRLDDAEVIMVAYGSTSRIVRDAIVLLGKEGIKAGLIRPKTLWPFPTEPFSQLPKSCKTLLCVEMSAGQMIDDVKLALHDARAVNFFGTTGGMIPTPAEIVSHVLDLVKKETC